MIGVFIIPTGIGANIGGHAGDGTPAARLIASCCDKLIVHPNVVNASDINEMTNNMLYVEGSTLDRFLNRDIQLEESNNNKILIVANSPVAPETINAVSASRVTLGIDAEILELKTPLTMTATMNHGCATGIVKGHLELATQVNDYDFDALAIHSIINVDLNIAKDYYRNGGINPWGGVEAKASKLIANLINKPVAHAPLENPNNDDELMGIYKEIIDPRITPEAISICYLHCVLKGLHKAPVISENRGIFVNDIDFMVSPYGCWGEPHLRCNELNIPIIIVRENTTCLNIKPGKSIIVENYHEAAGVIMGMKSGISSESVKRPIKRTVVIK